MLIFYPSQPPKGRDHNPSGLGRAIINKKSKDARRALETGLVRFVPINTVPNVLSCMLSSTPPISTPVVYNP